MQISFENKVALVTGAAMGMGLATDGRIRDVLDANVVGLVHDGLRAFSGLSFQIQPTR